MIQLVPKHAVAASASYLVRSIPKRTTIAWKKNSAEPLKAQPNVKVKPKNVKVKPDVELDLNEKDEHGLPTGNLLRLANNAYHLNQHFRPPEYNAPTQAQITETDKFFRRPTVKKEFLVTKYNEIPDVKISLKDKELADRLSRVEPYHWNQNHDNILRSKKSCGVEPRKLKPLPEVLFLGYTNSGKLSLINTLLLNLNQIRYPKAETEYCKVSKRAGYTKSLRFYNVNGQLRLVDSPGYGPRAHVKQGEFMMEYIKRRTRLRRTFMLIDSTEGVREEDKHLMQYMEECGTPFDIIFTKVDKVVPLVFPVFHHHPPIKDLDVRREEWEKILLGNKQLEEYFEQMILDGGLRDLATMPRLLFNNARVDKVHRRRFGFREIRYFIMDCCGLIKTQKHATVPATHPKNLW